jgi:hypothetical protein
MRRTRLAVAILALLTSWPAAVGAAPVFWEGTLTLDFLELPPMQFQGGGIATVNDSNPVFHPHLTSLRISAERGGITGMGVATATTGSLFAYADASLGTGTFAPASPSDPVRNRLPVRGLLRVCLFDPGCFFEVPVDLTEVTPMGFPRGVGLGGTVAGTVGALKVAIQASRWTIGTATATGVTNTTMGSKLYTLTAMGFAHAPASSSTYTVQSGGVVQFVTPMRVLASPAPYFKSNYADFGVLRVRFIPEPGRLVLLGSGGLLLAWLNRLRARRSTSSA